MSIATVITMGYGNGTLTGDVNLLPTLGYSIAVEQAVDTIGPEFTVRQQPPHFTVRQPPPHFTYTRTD